MSQGPKLYTNKPKNVSSIHFYAFQKKKKKTKNNIFYVFEKQ